MAKAPTVCAKRAPLYNRLLEAGKIRMVTASIFPDPHSCPFHHSSPMFRATVQSFGTLPSTKKKQDLTPGRANVIMLWSVLLSGSARITSPELYPCLKALPCLGVLHTCPFQEMKIQEIPSS